MGISNMHYRIIDTIGDRVLATDGDLTVERFAAWYGLDDAETEGQVSAFVNSLSTYKIHRYNYEASQYLGLIVECGDGSYSKNE